MLLTNNALALKQKSMNVKVILVLMENVWMGLGLILACVTLPTQGLLVMKLKLAVE
jgi:hypothetical protein